MSVLVPRRSFASLSRSMACPATIGSDPLATSGTDPLSGLCPPAFSHARFDFFVPKCFSMNSPQKGGFYGRR
jgi:hypothetical protein